MNSEKGLTTDWQQSPGWQSQVDDRDTGSDVAWRYCDPTTMGKTWIVKCRGCVLLMFTGKCSMSKRLRVCSRKDMGKKQEAELPSEKDSPYRAFNIKEEKLHRNVSSASGMLRKSHC